MLQLVLLPINFVPHWDFFLLVVLVLLVCSNSMVAIGQSLDLAEKKVRNFLELEFFFGFVLFSPILFYLQMTDFN